MNDLLSAYERADGRISSELRAIGEDERHASRRKRLRALQREVGSLRERLDVDARAWVNNQLPAAYELGATATAAEIGATFVTSQLHESAIKAMASDTMRSLLRGNANVEAGVKRLVRASVKQASLDKLLTGQTAVQTSRELRGELASKSVSAITYRNGAKHQIGDYADMVVRTQTARAYNLGTLNEAKQSGIRYAACSDGFGCGLTSHDDGNKADGKIYPLGEAMRNLISHPRCRRSWSSLADVKSRKEADALEQSGLLKRSDAQIADEREADLARAADQRARLVARDRRLEARRAKIAARAS